MVIHLFTLVLLWSPLLTVVTCETSSALTEFDKIRNNCTTAEQCGTNFVCTPERKCVCKFGLLAKADTPSSCDSYKCVKDKDCFRWSGFGSKCGSNGQCTCSAPMLIDPLDQRCKSPLGGRCESGDGCGRNVHCSEAKQCICNFGYLPNNDTIGCSRMACSGDQDCLSKFGDFCIQKFFELLKCSHFML